MLRVRRFTVILPGGTRAAAEVRYDGTAVTLVL